MVEITPKILLGTSENFYVHMAWPKEEFLTYEERDMDHILHTRLPWRRSAHYEPFLCKF